MRMTAKEKTEQALKLYKLYDFIYDYCYRGSDVFEKKYPEYEAWRKSQKQPDVMDFISKYYIGYMEK